MEGDDAVEVLVEQRPPAVVVVDRGEQLVALDPFHEDPAEVVVVAVVLRHLDGCVLQGTDDSRLAAEPGAGDRLVADVARVPEPPEHHAARLAGRILELEEPVRPPARLEPLRDDGRAGDLLHPRERSLLVAVHGGAPSVRSGAEALEGRLGVVDDPVEQLRDRRELVDHADDLAGRQDARPRRGRRPSWPW